MYRPTKNTSKPVARTELRHIMTVGPSTSDFPLDLSASISVKLSDGVAGGRARVGAGSEHAFRALATQREPVDRYSRDCTLVVQHREHVRLFACFCTGGFVRILETRAHTR